MHIHQLLMAEMAFSTAAVQLLLMMATMLVLAGAAAAVPSPPIGMPNCETRCGNVEVPYPLGLGSNASCYLPGFNLTCDHTMEPPRLLIDASLRVERIGDTFVSVVHTVGANKASVLGGALDLHDGPYFLPRGNELVVMGCNVQATLLRNPGNITVSSCLSFCRDGDILLQTGSPFGDPNDDVSCSAASPSEIGCCHAPAITDDKDDVAATYSVRLDWFGRNSSADKERTPFRAFLAQEEWFDYWRAMWPRPSAMEVPVYLDWKMGASLLSQYNFSYKSKHSNCYDDARGYTCRCDPGYSGNALVPDGCQVHNECEGITCHGVCIVKEGLPVCQCPSGTQGNSAMPGGCLNSTVTRADAAAGNCTRWCGGLHVPYPFGIQDMGLADCYKPGFNLTCDMTGHGPPRLLLGDDGELQVMKIHLENATVHAVRASAFINASSTHGVTARQH